MILTLLVFVPDRFKKQEMCNEQCGTGHGRDLFLIILGHRRRATR